MIFISYAPHCEDVPLWRALSDVPAGSYVDCVGPTMEGTADRASITRAFYDRGWQGVLLRPMSGQVADLAALRPRDTVLGMDDLALVASSLPDVIHFARIDGPEILHRLLRLLLPARPWIVVIRAEALDEAGTAAASLASAGYRFVLFDGRNRFYLSPQQAARAGRLEAPANADDCYVRASDGEAIQLARSEALLKAAEARVEGRSRRLLDAVRATGQARSDLQATAEAAAWLRTLVDEAGTREAALRAETAWLREQLAVEREQRHRDAEQKLGQLLARAAEVAWLRGCLEASEAEGAARRDEAAQAEQRAQRAEAMLARSRLLKATRAVRRLPGLLGARMGLKTKPQAGRALIARPDPALAAPTLASPALAGPAATDRVETDPVPATAPALAVDRAALATEPATIEVLPSPPQQCSLAVAAVIDARPASSNPDVIPPPSSPALRPSTTVHQFHAGSAQGDAITNAMLLIRSLLRAAGFHSEIFVQSRAAGLEGEVHLMEALPRHGGFVLLVHHSMGFSGFDLIAALPCRKVLIYHNITPPALLGTVPYVEQMAIIGRQQLVTWRDHVAFALADSEFNAVELHALGFDPVRTCTLLFDVDAIVRRSGAVRHDDGTLTVLFVGRVTPSKSQHDLIEAFALFRARLNRPSRLVLVGALNADEHRYLQALEDRIVALGLEAAVQLTGLVSDAELQGWYRQADLYVSLSHHEGFGVPLVEALAYGIPVLAWPTGAVPYTLSDAGILLASREPAAVADSMLAAAAYGRADAESGIAAIQRFAIGRQMPILMEALATAGAVPPTKAATTAVLAGNVRVTIAGQFDKAGSQAAMNRSLARTIEAQRPGTVRLLLVEDEQRQDRAATPTHEMAFIRALANRPEHESGPVLVLSSCSPPGLPPLRGDLRAAAGDLRAAIVCWEEWLAPAAMVAILNEQFDAVFVASRWLAKTLADSGVSVPLLNLGGAPDHLARYAALALNRRHGGAFTFLHVSSAPVRDGLDVLLAAWARAFTAADTVRLVVKTVAGPNNDAAAWIERMRSDHPDAAPVDVLDEDMPPNSVLALYRDADAAVLPTRGDGYNLRAAEAMAAGLPLIVTGFGGHLDFCDATTARLVARRFAASGSPTATPTALWAEPDLADLTAALREIHAGGGSDRVAAARAAILAATEPTAYASGLAAATATVLLAPKSPAMRVAWITSWDVPCGIAEYSRALLDALPRDRVAALTILADERTAAGEDVERAWRLGDDGGNAKHLITAITRVDAEVVMIQHQPGLLPWAVLADLLNGLAGGMPGRPRAVLVTLHNTRHLLDLVAVDQAAMVAALHRAARVVVHTQADVALLDGIGLVNPVMLLPHPAPPAAPSIIRELPGDAAPVIGSTGFFLPDKGLGALIIAVAGLRERWPGIRLRLVNAEYDHPSSAAEIAACRQLAAAEGLDVEWHTSFIPLAEQAALLQGCDALVLPYQRSQEASSAALRNALASGIPVAATPLPIFQEAAGVVFRLPGCEPAAIRVGVAELLQDSGQRRVLHEAARAWLADRATAGIARRLHGLMLGLATARVVGAPLDGSRWQPPRPQA